MAQFFRFASFLACTDLSASVPLAQLYKRVAKL